MYELCRFPPQALPPFSASHAAAATSVHTVPDSSSPAEPEDAAAASSAPKQRKRDPASAQRESAQPETPRQQSPEAAHVHAADAQPAVSKLLGLTGGCTPEDGVLYWEGNQEPERGSGRLSELAEAAAALLPPEADDAPGSPACLAKDAAACSGTVAPPTSADGELQHPQSSYCSHDAPGEAGRKQELSLSCEVVEPAGDYDSDAFWSDDDLRGSAALEEPFRAGGAQLASQPMQQSPKGGSPGEAGGRKRHKPHRLEQSLSDPPWDVPQDDIGASPALHHWSGPRLAGPADKVLPTPGAPVATNKEFSGPGGWQWVAPATDIERAGVTRVEQAWQALLARAQRPEDPPAVEGAAGASCGARAALTSFEASGERLESGAARCSGSKGGRGAAVELPTFPMLCRSQLRRRVLDKRRAAGLQSQQGSQQLHECGNDDLIGQEGAAQRTQQQPEADSAQPSAAPAGRPPAALPLDAPLAAVPQLNVLAEAAAWRGNPLQAAITAPVPAAHIPEKPGAPPPSNSPAAAGHLVRQQRPPPRAQRERKPTARWLGWFAEKDPPTAESCHNANAAHAAQLHPRQQLLPTDWERRRHSPR